MSKIYRGKKIYLFFKRLADLIAGAVILTVLLPGLLLIALSIKADSEGPVFFRQKRVGRYKRNFYILKFRTMSKDAPRDMPAEDLEDEDRWVTRVGRWLRKTSMDELPQLINIIKGDMSFVGPRPALWNEEKLIKKRDENGANDVPAGLTGWAQVKKRHEHSFKSKAELDGEYVRMMGVWTDLKCIAMTFPLCVGLARGYSNKNERTERSDKNESVGDW